MSEAENNTQEAKPKTSKLATGSVVCVILQFCHFLSVLIVADYLKINSIVPNPLLWKVYELSTFVFFVLFLVATPVLGVTALVKIKRSKSLLVGKGRVLIAIVVWFFISLVIFNPVIAHIASLRR